MSGTSPLCSPLPESYSDLGQHVEQRYYLESALQQAKDMYWGPVLALRLALASIDSGCCISSNTSQIVEGLEESQLPPRVSQLWRLVRSEPHDAAIDTWLEDSRWLISWHSSESCELYAQLEKTAKRVIELLEGCAISQSQAKGIIVAIKDALSRLSKQRRGSPGQLVSIMRSDPPENDRHALWATGSSLYLMLFLFKQTFEKTEGWVEPAVLRRWRLRLRRLLFDGTADKAASGSARLAGSRCFRQFRSEVQELELFADPVLQRRVRAGKCRRKKISVCQYQCAIDSCLAGKGSPQSGAFFFF